MVALRKVDAENMWEVAALEVSPEQRWLVTSARDSFIEAWGITASGGHALPIAVYDDDTPVGFVFITHEEKSSMFDGSSYEINHFYIDKDHQHMGYGKKAIRLVVDFIKTLPLGPADLCWIAWKPSNAIAKNLYVSAGFTPVDDVKNGDEDVAILKL